MSPSTTHRSVKPLIGRMIEIFTEVLDIDIRSVSSTTFKRADLKRAFEADESYYIQNAALVRGKDEIDLTIIPSRSGQRGRNQPIRDKQTWDLRDPGDPGGLAM